MEIPIEDASDLFLGKTIKKMDASSCNQVEFLFTDGTKVALHIELIQLSPPIVLACSDCAESV